MSAGDPKGVELTLKSEKEKFDELWKTTEWHNKDSVVKLFPVYVQEQHVFKKVNKKVASGKVEIDNFTMKTPFGDKELLKNTSLVIEPHTRQCLYGHNSTGKTLLFTNMSEGKIKDFPKHIHIHHCKELETHELSESVLDTVVNSHPFINVLKIVKPKVEEVLAAAKTEGSGVAPELVAQYQDVLDWVKFYMNGLRIDESVEKASKMLRVLGFDDVGQKKPCSALSGGLRMRVALCMAFFIEADLLLLDEPTNHLDFPSVLWLENRLRGYKSSFLLVSHDRELLNNVVNSVVLIEDLQLKYYSCSFKDFEKKKATEDKKKFDDIEKFLAKNLNADPSTMAGKLRAEKKAWSEKYYQAQIAMAGKFTFPKATPLAKQLDENGQPKKPEDISLIHLKNVRFSWAPEVENPVFIFNDPISFNVTASTRVGCLGPNGAGKSTFLKLLTGKIIPSNKPGDKHKPDIGEVVTNPNFILAYFGQHSTAELDLELTAIEFMGQQFPNEQAGHLRNHLAKTGVVGPVQDTRMQRLSFSQRSCVIFSKLTFVCPHLLIMDEPTNFLDLESVDSLIAACNKYAGALLLVSHNRDFLRKCAKQYLSIVPGHFELYNDLKTAERATYTFIAEMEEGGSVGKGMDLSKGGGSVHASQVAGGVATAAKANNGVISMSSPMPSAAEAQKIAAAKAAVKYAVGEKVQALWTDGKWYAGLVKKVVDPVKGVYAVTYTAYGNTANLPSASIKKDEPKAAAAPKKK